MKRNLLLFTVVVLLLCMTLSACSGDKAISGIKITGGLAYTYEIGATPDFSKVTADITYNDNTSVSVTAADLTFGSIDTATAGVKKLTITYKDYSITVDVTVKAAVVLAKPTAIQIISAPTTALVGEALDTTGIKALVTFDDGTTKTVEAAELTIGTLDTSTAGEKTLTVAYGELSANVTITVHGIAKIEVDGDSIDTTVEVGEEIDLTSLKVYAVYTNDARVLLNNADLTITLPDTDTEGDDKVLVIAYGGHEVRLPVSSVPPTLESISINANSYVKKVPVGSVYSTAGITATALYSNNTSKQIATDALTFSAIDTSVAGEVTVTVTFEDKTATFTVKVLNIASVTVLLGSKTSVTVGTEYDASGVQALIIYDTDLSVTVTAADGLEIGTLDTDTVGQKTLTVTYRGVQGTATVTVTEPTYGIDGVQMPNALSAFEANKKNYKDSTAPYKVGDDNPFRFALTLKIYDPVTDNSLPDITDYVGFSRVYLVENGSELELTDDALAAMVAIDDVENTFDFTEAAIGKTFRLETRPRYGLEESDYATMTRSMTVLVVDAYNIYSAKELNLITNTNSKTITDLGQSAKEQLDLVNDFLANNNITRPEKLAGVVFHGDLNITVDDIPAGYLFSYTNAAGEATKGFYDHFSIFAHVVDLANPTFTIYGNYFSLYTEDLPLVCENGYGDNDDQYSSTELFNLDVADAAVLHYGTGYDQSLFNSRVENLYMRGEDPNSNVAEDSPAHMLGLIGFKTHMHNVHYYNIKVEAYLIGICVDGDNQTTTIEKSVFHNAWQGHLYLWGSNRLQNDILSGYDNVAPIDAYRPIVVNIKDSSLTKCGGPVIIADYQDMKDAHNAKCGVEIYVDATSVLWSYVTGQEAWFVANGVSQLAGQILALNKPINDMSQLYGNGTNASITSTSNTGMNGIATANLIFANRGPRGKIVVEGEGTMDMTDQTMRAVQAGFKNATGQDVPVLQSAAGGIAGSDGQSQVFSPTMSAPDATFFQGDYMNLFMNTPLFEIGVFMQYYHE